MSATKNRATSSLLRSEKRSLFRFLALYATFTLLLISALSYYYYESQKTLMLSDKRATLATYAYEQTKRLKALHQAFPKKRTYPRDERFTSAIYDIQYHRIFSLNRTEPHAPRDFFKEIDMRNGYIHYIKDLDIFYLGARYLVLEIPDDGAWARHAWRNIALYGGGALLFMALLGWYLAKRFVAPMRDAILLLDRFIADTTHELNTPLSTILANIETVKTDELSDKNRKKLERITAAAKQVSLLYRDLTYLVLEKKRTRNMQPLDMASFVRQRITYFETLAQMKRVQLFSTLGDLCLKVDPNDMQRLLDNLLSNAVKYNKPGGQVHIYMRRDAMCIEDTGIGIAEADIPLLFDRYMRFSDKEGGFGVGLSIVSDIVKRYGWHIDVTSQKGVGTRICVSWKKEDRC